MKESVKKLILRFENGFFSNVLKRGLGMMIPLLLVGAFACALRDLPVPLYQSWLAGEGRPLYLFFHMIYEGTFGIFSLAMVIALSVSYVMEKNESYDYIGLYVLVSLGAFGTQLNIGSEGFDIAGLGTQGSFAAIFVTYLSCVAYTALRKVRIFSLENYTAGMGGICVQAIQTFFPMAVIVSVVALFNQLLYALFGVYSLYEFFTTYLCRLFETVGAGDGFASGLLYTFLVHLLWFFGLHGSHILEPVAQNTFAFTGDTIFSKPFFDIFVMMGGCGTTICVLIALVLFFRKERVGKLAGLALWPAIFNVNEILTFGIPIILNPVLGIPFILTPIVCYCLSYAATATGLVPQLTQTNTWTIPVFVGGYLATDSLRGTLLQVLCITVGVLIYLPFLRINSRLEQVRSKEEVGAIILELQQKEEQVERPAFLTRGDRIGATSRALLHDLQRAVRNRELFLLYQPQMSADGRCVGAEALLRWKHPIYGLIYPPLIIYLAEEGKLLPELEDFILDEVTTGIDKLQKVYDGPFKMSVNLTAHSLLWDVEKCIEQHLAAHNIAAEKLWIEITEQDVLLQTDAVSRKLNAFKEAGHMLLIDDFGMGHTSLLYLQSNFFGIVKLDGSLIRTIETNETNQKIVASIVELAKELGVGVIAEYVETREQQQLLERLGCTCYQGYLFSKPVPLEEFIEYQIAHSPQMAVRK
ncbi:MAG: EAL domain-containing protein [Muribaculaceae bacterium]|nr:EAL domain-containing protein [Roseburia sp.]MCM1430626.1 EAL domain-containing protein [Muribaculaceae bacterium]MCM1491893.1 EAL domain-containing protein [Muribaculaceae bacterium]